MPHSSRRIGLLSRLQGVAADSIADTGRSLAAALGFYRARPRMRHDRRNPIKSALRRDDGRLCMANAISVFQPNGYHPPVTGAERMRDFRRRNPGYDRKYKAQRRAALKARQMAREAQKVAAFAEMLAPAQARDTLLLLPAPPVRLALPAPLLDPTMAAINALAMRRIQVPVAA